MTRAWGEWIDPAIFPDDDPYDMADEEDRGHATIVCRHGYPIDTRCLYRPCERKPWGTLDDWQAEHAALTEANDLTREDHRGS